MKDGKTHLEVSILALTTLIGFLKENPNHGTPHKLMNIDALTEAVKFQYDVYLTTCTLGNFEPETLDEMLGRLEMEIPQIEN